MKRCCTGLGTLWKVSRAGEILWRRDHFAGWDAAEDAALAASVFGQFPLRATCVSCDDAGNVIVGSNPSRASRDNPNAAQPPMWTVRCYSPAGELRWSWASHPFGTIRELVYPPVGSPQYRFPPPTPNDVRLAPSRQGHAWGPPPSLAESFGQDGVWSRSDRRGRTLWTQAWPLPPIDGDPNSPESHALQWPEGAPLGVSRTWLLFVQGTYRVQSQALMAFDHDGTVLPGADLLYVNGQIASSIADGIFGEWYAPSVGSYDVDPANYRLIDPDADHAAFRIEPPESGTWDGLHGPRIAWVSAFHWGTDGIGNPLGGLLLATPDYVGFIGNGIGSFGNYIVLRAADGSLAARGTVGEVPVIDGEVIPPTTEGLGWALAGGAMYDDDGRPLWRPAGVTVRDTAIDGSENCYFATDRGVLSIDRLDR